MLRSTSAGEHRVPVCRLVCRRFREDPLAAGTGQQKGVIAEAVIRVSTSPDRRDFKQRFRRLQNLYERVAPMAGS